MNPQFRRRDETRTSARRRFRANAADIITSISTSTGRRRRRLRRRHRAVAAPSCHGRVLSRNEHEDSASFMTQVRLGEKKKTEHLRQQDARSQDYAGARPAKSRFSLLLEEEERRRRDLARAERDMAAGLSARG